jgi:hypothetical protein
MISAREAPRTEEPYGRTMPLNPDDLSRVLATAEHVYVAVRARSGPHVTPELFTVSGGRILCVTAASTLKAKILRRRPLASIAAVSDDRLLTALGTVEVLDPASPTTALAAPALAAQAPLAVARFLRDNAAELAGAAVQAVTGQLGRPLPPRRVVLAITLTAATLVDGDTVTVDDGWDPPSADVVAEDTDDSDVPDLSALSADLRDLAVSGSAVVGWTRLDGTPLALPATWDADRSVATVPTSLFRSSGGAVTSQACVTFDRWTGYGPSGKQGLMLRGVGQARGGDRSTQLSLTVTRASHWDGIDVGTTDLASSD